jgi:large subunit ribosomal protein L24
MVEVIGGKFSGKRGKVLQVLAEDGRAIVEGVNLVKRHMKPTQKVPQGGIVEKEAPLPTSRLMVVCAKCGEATRLGARFLGDGT